MIKHKTVHDFLTSLDNNQSAQVEAIRKIISSTEPSIVENIKWNAINYVYKGNDRITFNILNKENKIKLILHKGSQEKEDKKAKPIIDDKTGLVTWISNIRGTILFDDLKEISSNAKKLSMVVRLWLDI